MLYKGTEIETPEAIEALIKEARDDGKKTGYEGALKQAQKDANVNVENKISIQAEIDKSKIDELSNGKSQVEKTFAEYKNVTDKKLEEANVKITDFNVKEKQKSYNEILKELKVKEKFQKAVVKDVELNDEMKPEDIKNKFIDYLKNYPEFLDNNPKEITPLNKDGNNPEDKTVRNKGKLNISFGSKKF